MRWNDCRSGAFFLLTVLITLTTDAGAAPRPEDRTIVVVGATGRQGGAVARELLARGYRVRALTRSPDSSAARDLASSGADLIQGDLNEPASLDRALAQAYGVFGVTVYAAHDAEGEARQGRNLVDAAQRAGVKHLVFSSVGSADRETGIPHFESKREIELHLKQSGLQFTILRPVSFMDNWSDAARRLADGELRDALKPTTRQQYTSVRDIGRFAAEAFDHPKVWLGRELDIAGDELTMAELAVAFGRVLGRDVSYRQISWAELRQQTNAENEMMKRWFDAVGYDVNVKALRREFPWMQSLDDYLRGRNWNTQ